MSEAEKKAIEDWQAGGERCCVSCGQAAKMLERIVAFQHGFRRGVEASAKVAAVRANQYLQTATERGHTFAFVEKASISEGVARLIHDEIIILAGEEEGK